MKLFLILSLLFLPALVFAQSDFVSLTNAPFIEGAGNADTLPDFLNQLYRLCIGVAAVVAVLQIMHAGIMYMGGDSVTEKKEAKNLIALSIGGLILVLSPVIVFSIVNPDILSLKIGNLDSLAVGLESRVCEPACEPGQSCVSGTCVPNNVVGDNTCNLTCTTGNICREGACVPVDPESCPAIGNGVSVPSVTAQNCCVAQAGCTVRMRIPEGSDMLLGIATCSCQQTVTIDIETSLDITKYMTLANTGVGDDRGPVGSMRDLFNRYTEACAAAGKEVRETYGERRKCTEEELADYPYDSSAKPYLWCVPTTLSCSAS